jgi:hypothetical protein
MGKRTLTTILLAGLCLAVSPVFANPLQKNQIGPGANWVVHADLDAFRGSQFGKLMMDELKTQGVEEKLQSFATIFSFNPLTDVHNITLYGKGKDRNNAVAIVDGQFDAQKLISLIRLNPQFQETPYQGVTLYRWQNEDKKGGQAESQLMYGFVREGRGVVISTGLDALKQAADNLKGSGAGNSTGLAGQIPPAESGTFLQVVASSLGGLTGDDPKAAILKQTDLFTAGAGETADKVFATLHLRGQSPEVADNVMKMVQGVVAMAQLATQEQPKLSELAKNVNVTRQDKTVQVRFEAPAQSVFAFLKEQWEQKKQQPKPTTPGTTP